MADQSQSSQNLPSCSKGIKIKHEVKQKSSAELKMLHFMSLSQIKQEPGLSNGNGQGQGMGKNHKQQHSQQQIENMISAVIKIETQVLPPMPRIPAKIEARRSASLAECNMFENADRLRKIKIEEKPSQTNQRQRSRSRSRSPQRANVKVEPSLNTEESVGNKAQITRRKSAESETPNANGLQPKTLQQKPSPQRSLSLPSTSTSTKNASSQRKGIQLIEPSPLPARIQGYKQRRDQRITTAQNTVEIEDHTELNSFREQARRGNYNNRNRLGYEGRNFHRHPHQQRREDAYFAFQHNLDEEDLDEDHPFNRIG